MRIFVRVYSFMKTAPCWRILRKRRHEKKVLRCTAVRRATQRLARVSVKTLANVCRDSTTSTASAFRRTSAGLATRVSNDPITVLIAPNIVTPETLWKGRFFCVNLVIHLIFWWCFKATPSAASPLSGRASLSIIVATNCGFTAVRGGQNINNMRALQGHEEKLC